jgi:hypothetical protein
MVEVILTFAVALGLPLWLAVEEIVRRRRRPPTEVPAAASRSREERPTRDARPTRVAPPKAA